MRTNYAVLARAMRFAPQLGRWLFFREASDADQAVMGGHDVKRRFRQTLLEAACQGARGIV